MDNLIENLDTLEMMPITEKHNENIRLQAIKLNEKEKALLKH